MTGRLGTCSLRDLTTPLTAITICGKRNDDGPQRTPKGREFGRHDRGHTDAQRQAKRLGSSSVVGAPENQKRPGAGGCAGSLRLRYTNRGTPSDASTISCDVRGHAPG
jgi:hypothetical protein